MSSLPAWTYCVGDVVVHGWKIVAYTGRTGPNGRPVYRVVCPTCRTGVEELTGPQMKMRARGCFKCRWARTTAADRQTLRVRKCQARDVNVAAIEAVAAAKVKAAVLSLHPRLLWRIVQAVTAAGDARRKPDFRRKYYADQEFPGVRILDDGVLCRGKNLRGKVFYNCRCHGCRTVYTWDNRQIAEAQAAGCQACRRKLKKKQKGRNHGRRTKAVPRRSGR